jgi:hypothetical protein
VFRIRSNVPRWRDRWRSPDGGTLGIGHPGGRGRGALRRRVAELWICFSIHKTLRDPRTPPAEGVLLDLGLGLMAVTAAVFWLVGSLSIYF